ncbi:hypothetical protein J6590_058751 [Homalodisca vitripennis]|nr:hypothetical protein J6590_058751 [Homalodisca vitripennis]
MAMILKLEQRRYEHISKDTGQPLVSEYLRRNLSQHNQCQIAYVTPVYRSVVRSTDYRFVQNSESVTAGYRVMPGDPRSDGIDCLVA